jgi:hypothetical protein
MPPSSNINKFRDKTIASYEAGVPVSDIFLSIQAEGCKGTQRTLERPIQAWGLQRKGLIQSNLNTILPQIEYLFFVRGWKDQSIQQELQKSGYSVSLRTIQDLRLQHGMKRRYRTNNRYVYSYD